MAVEQSILKSTKVMLDVAPDDPSFDGQLIGYLNGVLSDLPDLGIGPEGGFVVEGEDEVWDNLIGAAGQDGRIKNWIWLRVRMLWDPPQTSFLQDSFRKQIDEATWRMVNKVDGDSYVSTSDLDDDILILDGGS